MVKMCFTNTWVIYRIVANFVQSNDHLPFKKYRI